MTQVIKSFDEWHSYHEKHLTDEKKAKALGLIHANVRSLQKNWDLIELYLKKCMTNLDVIVLTEVNVNTQAGKLYQMHGFQQFSLCRDDRRGGGILIYVKNSWLCEQKEVSFLEAEAMLIAVQDKELSFVILAVYRPPAKNTKVFLNELESLLRKLDRHDNVILVGDFNIDIISPDKFCVPDYLTLTSGYGFEHKISGVTREEPYGTRLSRSCLDHINVRIPDMDVISGIITQKVADHYFVVISVLRNEQSSVPKMNVESKYALDNGKVDKLVNGFDWDSLIQNDHSLTYDEFISQFQVIYRQCTKKINVRRRKVEKPWINSEIMELSLSKERLWYRCKKDPSNLALKEELRQLRNRLTAKLRIAKNLYYKHELNKFKRDPRKTWSIVNALSGRTKKSSIDETITTNFQGIDMQALANNFNQCFANTAVRLRSTNPPMQSSNSTLLSNVHSAYMYELTEQEILAALKTLSLTRSPGHDCIRVRDIFVNFQKLKKLLHYILSNILNTGVIPTQMKVSLIRPIYKGGQKQQYNNYRPIAILPTISCLLEKIIHKRMISFCEKYKLLSNTQYGFCEGRSTTTLLEDLSDYVNDKIDNNKIVISLFLDLRKAFDTIDHTLLLNKLSCLGFRGVYADLFSNYFQNRYQVVRINDTNSNLLPIKYGVPQGSILGPLLFNFYVNDLAQLSLKSKIFQYADDTALLLASESYMNGIQLMQDDIYKLIAWFNRNYIFLNREKTQFSCFHSPYKNLIPRQNFFCMATRASIAHAHPLIIPQRSNTWGFS